jgi:uncharacterized secreted protein with C-terminal beta-propeller domain
MRRRTAWTGIGIAAALAAGGCSAAPGGAHKPLQAATHRGSGAIRLAAFDGYEQLLAAVRAQATAAVGPYGLSGTGGAVPATPDMRAAGPLAGAAAHAASASAAPAPGTETTTGLPTFSSTNNQEVGVDELDLAKTDGSLLVALRRTGPALQVADVGAAPRLRGSLSLASLGAPDGLFLVGHRAVVLLRQMADVTPAPPASPPSTSAPADVAPIQAAAATTVVAVVSLTDPDHPAIERSFTIQGDEVDARLIGGHVEVVVTSAPHLPFVVPSSTSAAALGDAQAANRAVIAAAPVGDFLPVVTASSGTAATTPACTKTMHTAAATGLDSVSVVPIDPAAAQPELAVTVLGDASTVYAGATSLYVATTDRSAPVPVPGPPVPEPMPMIPSAGGAPVPATSQVSSSSGTGSDESTTIHGFDLSDPSAPRYVGSGTVPGTLIGQYALSDYQGYLRVATTVGTPSPAPAEGTAPATPSDNRITVLHGDGGSLVPVGSASGLGAGEKIYAVRYVGPLAYVVTFRQTDPLYVVDLSDPAHPHAAGQLALTGYSSFLQPVGGNHLLGIGQAVDANLRTSGLQVSLFDVTDPSHPSLVSKLVLAGAGSSAEDDPHALLYWAPAGLAVMPLQQYDPAGGGAPTSPFDGAVAFHVGPGSLTEAGRVSQPATAPTPVPVDPAPGEPPVAPMPMPVAPVPVPAPMVPGTTGGGSAPGAVGSGVALGVAMPYGGTAIERELVVGSMLYTVSEAGIMVSDLGTFAQQAWMAYA